MTNAGVVLRLATVLAFAVVTLTAGAQIRPANPGAVWPVGTCVRLEGAGPEGRLWHIRDWRGATRDEVASDSKGRLEINGLPPGFWTPVSGCETGLSFTVVVDPSTRTRDPESPFAVDASFSWNAGPSLYVSELGDTYAHVANLMRLAGVTEVRERLCWGHVQPQADVAPQWNAVVPYLNNAKLLSDHGIRICGMFHDAPAWACHGAEMPRDLTAVYRFTEAAARAFGDRMRMWEFWNEEDLWMAPIPVWEFAALQKAASLGFRAGNPAAAVVNGATCNIDSTYVRSLLANDLVKYCDAYNFHTYEHLNGTEATRRKLREFTREVGGSGYPYVITECGTDQEGPARGPGLNGQQHAHAPEQELAVAEYVPKSQILSQMGGVLRQYFFLFGVHSERDGLKDWGTLRRDGTAKPAVAAFAQMTDALAGATPRGEVDLGKSARGFLYSQGEGRKTLAFWAESDLDAGVLVKYPLGRPAVPIRVPCSGTATLTDWCGTPQRLSPVNGLLEVKAERFVSYLSGDIGLEAVKPAFPCGSPKRYRPTSDEDLTVVATVRFSTNDFVITDMKTTAELRHPEGGRVQIELWNLSGERKTGALEMENGTADGLPPTIVLEPWGVRKYEVKIRPSLGNNGLCRLVLGGVFNGRRISRFSANLFDMARMLAGARAVPVRAAPDCWVRNDSAADFAVREDAGATRFDVAWRDPAVDRWFYPQLVIPPGLVSKAGYIQYEVRCEQDKVENDFTTANLYLPTCMLPVKPPQGQWETRRVALPAGCDFSKGLKIDIGANPRGMRLSWWIRNVRFLVL